MAYPKHYHFFPSSSFFFLFYLLIHNTFNILIILKLIFTECKESGDIVLHGFSMNATIQLMSVNGENFTSKPGCNNRTYISDRFGHIFIPRNCTNGENVTVRQSLYSKRICSISDIYFCVNWSECFFIRFGYLLVLLFCCFGQTDKYSKILTGNIP